MPNATARARRAWKDAWFSFRSLIWTRLENPGWCWFSRALQLYREEEPDVLAALDSEFDDLSWWTQWTEWTEWNDRYEHLLPSTDDLRRASLTAPLPSELPLPPEEPPTLWTQTQELWTSDDRCLAIGGATIRTVLARGRATRNLRGE